MQLELTLPPLTNSLASPPDTRPAEARAWLEGLPGDQPLPLGRAIADYLSTLNRVEIPFETRLELLELFLLAAEPLWTRLEAVYAVASHPMTPDVRRAADTSRDLAIELANGYKRLLMQQATRRIGVGLRKTRVALIHRVQQALARTLAVSYLSYHPVPVGTWQDLHRTYLYLRGEGLADAIVGTEENQTTLEVSYLQVLLLGLANPYGFRPGQLAIALNFLGRNAALARLSTGDRVSLSEAGLAVVPIEHDAPPRPIHINPPMLNAGTLLLRTEALVTQIDNEINQLLGRDPRPVGERNRFAEYLRALRRAWSGVPPRHAARREKHGSMLMTAGLGHIWHRLRAPIDGNGGTHRTPSAGRQNVLEEVEVRSTLDLRHLHQANDHQDFSVQIVNHGSDGFALRALLSGSAKLRVGDLVELRGERQPNQLAVIRWIRSGVRTAELDFGVQMIAGELEPVTLKREGEEGVGVVPGILIFPYDQDMPKQLVAPRGQLDPAVAVLVHRGDELVLARTQRPVEQTAFFDQFVVAFESAALAPPADSSDASPPTPAAR